MSLDRLLAEVDRIESIELLRDLVRIPSHRGLPRQEAAVARLLADFLADHGLQPQLQVVRDERPNLLCTVGADGGGRHLLLCGHTDTVPLNEGEPGVAFSGELRDGRVLGRGAVDMKGALAAMAAAVVALGSTEALDRGRVTLAAVIDEEMESLGVEFLVRSGFAADGAIVGEPSMNRILLGHKGLEWLQFEFRGRAAHGGTPSAGVNAIEAASRFIQLVGAELKPRFEERRDSLIGVPTLNFGTIEGGDQPSTVAAHCTLSADRRSVPGEDFASICRELEDLLARVGSEMPGLATALRRSPGGMATMEHVALKTSAADALVEAAAAARQRVCGSAGEFGAFPAWTDGALLAEFAGIPTIIMGPGDLALAHSPRESVEVEQVLEATKLYAATAVEYCRR